MKIGWDGWAFLEVSERGPDRVSALAEQHAIWEAMVDNSLKRAA